MNGDLPDARLQALLASAHPTAPFPGEQIHARVADATRAGRDGPHPLLSRWRPGLHWRLALGVAAAAAIFAAGAAYGGRARERLPEPAPPPLDIQAAGSAWVARLAQLTQAATLTAPGREAARQVSVATLYAATVELRRIVPGDALLAAIESLLEAQRHSASEPAGRLAAVWF